MIEAKVMETKTLETKAKFDKSIHEKYCFICEHKTVMLHLMETGNDGIGTVNLCNTHYIEMEAQKVKGKYGGDMGALLKKNAEQAAVKAKEGAKKLWSFAKELMK